MRKTLLSFFILLTTLTVQAQIVNIPDANFKNALLNHNPVIDLNGDGQIQVSEAVAVTGNIIVSNKNIFDLTGIQAFINIQALYCDNNQLTTLNFGNLTRLTTLECRSNKLISLNVTNLPSLVILTCHVNQLTSLPLNQFPSLQALSCYSNKLTSLVFNNSVPLYILDCSNNLLTTLTINNSSNLWMLECNNNQITSLSLGNSPRLQILVCSNNKIASLTIGNAPLLTDLYCNNNMIPSMSLNNVSSLQVLQCGNNKISSLLLNNANNLKYLYCSYNKLTALSFTNYPFLQRIDCDYNNLTSITLIDLPALKDMFCDSNLVTSLILNNLPNLEILFCNYNQLTSLNINGLPSLQMLRINNNQLTSLLLSNLPGLFALECGKNFLTSLDLSQTPVIYLTCPYNPNLEYINIKNGAITTNASYFNFVSLPVLQSICADEAEISVVNNALNIQLPGNNVSVSSFCNFNPNGNYNTITGVVRFDGNANGCNSLDSAMYNLKININDGVQTGATFTNKQGNYKFYTGLNNHTVTPFFPNSWFNSTPTSQIISFSTYGNTQIADFCVTPVGIHPDLEIALLPIGVARPGFDAIYKLVYRNKGNQVQSGTVTLTFNNIKLNFISAIPPPTSQGAGNLSWTYTGLFPYETRVISLIFHVNASPVVILGDVLSFVATVNPVSGDETPVDNIFYLDQIVRSAIDPNDKQITEGSQITIDKLGEYLHYVIRFQNTGTANAISVIVKDSLSANLDLNSFEPIIASHPYRTVITKGNLVEFIFDGINLPPKVVNEPASNGFVSFKIKPKGSLAVGDAIQNTAKIYFDFNLPIITNTVTTTIYKLTTNNIAGLTVYSNPTKDYLSFSVKPGVEVKAINLFNMMGQKMNIRITESTATNRKIDVSNFANGVYFLELISNLGKVSQKVMIVK